MQRDAELLELAMLTARIEQWPEDSQERMMGYLVSRFGHGKPVRSTDDARRERDRERKRRLRSADKSVDTSSDMSADASADAVRVFPHTPDMQLPEVSNGSRKSRPYKREAIEVLGFLNEKVGKTFRAVDTNLKLIEARIASGATAQNCKSVIARKAREWKNDPKMSKFLRPATLFSESKFEQYLGEREPNGAGDGA